MPRQARPWWRASHNGWYVTMDGKQVSLGINDPAALQAALAAWQQLLTTQQPKEETAGTVAERVRAYLAELAERVKPDTLRFYRWYLGAFAESFKDWLVSALTAKEIEANARRATWSQSTRNTYLGTVSQFLTGIGCSLRLHKPRKQSAGARAVITEETYHCVLTHVQGDWHAFVTFLWETVVRPAEAAAVMVELVDWQQRIVTLREHKTAETGHDRVLYLSVRAYDVLVQQRAKYPTGFLFRSRVDGRISRDQMGKKFQRLSKRVGKRVNAYFFRHSWASRALAAGIPDAHVATMLGHRSTQMVYRHYAHLGEHARQIRASLGKLDEKKAG